MRKWDQSGAATEEGDDLVLDYSAPPAGSTDDENDEVSRPKIETVGQDTWGIRTTQGQFVLKDLDDEINGILREANSKEKKLEQNDTGAKSGGLASGLASGAIGYLRNFVGGKTLTKEDTEKAIASIMTHLLEKNVAREAAVQICDSVQTNLIGQKTGSFQSKFSTCNTVSESQQLIQS